MHTFQLRNSKIDLLHNGRCVLEGLSVSLKTDSGTHYELLPAAAGKGEGDLSVEDYLPNEMHFRQADVKARCTLRIESRDLDNVGLLWVDLTLQQEPFKQNVSLALEGGVEIRISSIPRTDRWMAAYRHKDWWTRPAFGTDPEKIPLRTQSFLAERPCDYLCMIPVSHGGYTAELGTGLNLRLSSLSGGLSRCSMLALAFSIAENPYAAVRQAVSFAAERISVPLLRDKLSEDPGNGGALLNYLGWCSWDAFYHEVTEEGIRAKAAELQEKKVPVKWIIIDDGWLQQDAKKLRSFAEDPAKFPSGFKALTEELKNSSGINHVGVWHALAGYWGGVKADSKLAEEQRGNLFETGNGTLIPHPDPSRGFAFWHSWYSYLQEQGISFVKVDGQSALANHLRCHMPVGDAAKGTHAGLEAAAGIHFPLGVINCMGMAGENIWNRPVSVISRNSDDFVPQQNESFAEHGGNNAEDGGNNAEDGGNFAEHALQNIYNSLHHGQFYRGDWDMFWSRHPDSRRHALLRAISGGPIYISDPVGETLPEAIKPLIFSDGSIVRCDQQALPGKDCLMHNPLSEPVLLKAWNTCRGTGAVAVFHISEIQEPLNGLVSFEDIEGMEDRDGYIYDVLDRQVHAAVTRNADAAPELPLNHEAGLAVSLEPREAAMYQLMPKHQLATPIGLLDSYLPITGVEWQEELDDVSLFKLRDIGLFGFIAEDDQFILTMDGQEVVPQKLGDFEGAYQTPCIQGSIAAVRRLQKVRTSGNE